MINFIKNLFKKKELEWFYFNETKNHDISNMPDLSPNSPIKDFNLTHRYKYCPENKKLMHSLFRNWTEYTNKEMSQELIEFIEKCDIEYNRDKKLSKLLK